MTVTPEPPIYLLVEQCAAPFKLADNETGQISFEALAREFSLRQQAATKVLRLLKAHPTPESDGDHCPDCNEALGHGAHCVSHICDKQREISDNIEGVCAVYESLMAQYRGGLVYHPHTAAAQVWSMRKALDLYASKPVSVSLEKCAEAADKAPWGEASEYMKGVAKAVLDAAVVKYVE